MATELKDVMAFILKAYPQSLAHELSNARVTKMVYLADWCFAIHHKKQITSIRWYFDTYGPFVKDIENTAKEFSDIFVINYGNNRYGRPKKTLELKNANYPVKLESEVETTIEYVVSISKNLYWDGFIKLVYSSYPIRNSDRYTHLDLKALASGFRKEQKALADSTTSL